MKETSVHFLSSGLRLSGVFRVPDGIGPDERRPAFIVLHGFGSNKNAGNVLRPCAFIEELGYITFRFDMRGCSESEGERARDLSLDQIADTQSVITALATPPNVDPARN